MTGKKSDGGLATAMPDRSEMFGKITFTVVFGAIWAFGILSTVVALHAHSLGVDALPSTARVLSALSTTLFTTMLIVFVWRRRGAVRRLPGWGPRLEAWAGTFGPILFVLLPRADLGSIGQMVAFALVLAGTGSALYVLHFLSNAFSLAPEARHLVTDGPYAVVRHPLYVCEAVAILGMFLQVASWTGLLILCLQMFFQLRRMRNEERVLSSAFKDYEAYARRTPRLFPRIRSRAPAVACGE